MKKLSLVLASSLLVISLSSCSDTDKVLSIEEQASKYGLTVEKYKEMKQAALSMNMSIEEHLKMMGPVSQEVQVESDNYIYPEIPGSTTTELSLTGTIVSNKTADIFSRRTGIASDIKVDVGDRVYKGQVIATLLPIGVENEGWLIASEQEAMVAKADISSKTAEVVKQEQIALKEAALRKAESELKFLLNKTKSQQDLAEISFPQALARAEASASFGISVVSRMIFEHSTFSNTQASIDDMSAVLGALDWNLKKEALADYQQLQVMKINVASMKVGVSKIGSIQSLLSKSIKLLAKTRVLLDKTTTSGTYTPEILAKHKQEVDSTIISLRKNQDELERAKTTESLVGAETALEVTKMRENIEIAKQELSATRATEDAKVEIARKGLEAAKASLSKTQARHLNTTVRSPFSGIIAERFFSVGESVSEKNPIFRLDNVQTSLAKIAPLEVKFRVPEGNTEDIDLGDIVKVSLLDHEDRVIEAVVYRKSTLVDPDLHTIQVQAKIDPKLQVPSNAIVKVEFNKTHIPEGVSPIIPKSAVIQENDSFFIHQLQDSGEEEKIEIEIEKTTKEGVFISSTLDLTKKIRRNPSIKALNHDHE